MSDTRAVALLFDDAELGSQLREALQEHGARIVHEGGLLSLDAELLRRVDADVVVINLDDHADDALDHLYAVIDGNRPGVVFNDAQASRTLDGWDRARWARHLAAKVLAMGDLDPPRPGRAGDVPPPEEALPAPPFSTGAVDGRDGDEGGGRQVAYPPFDDAAADRHAEERQTVSESETLEAELEALLAAEPPAAPGDVDTGLNDVVVGEWLHDGGFSATRNAGPARFDEFPRADGIAWPVPPSAAMPHESFLEDGAPATRDIGAIADAPEFASPVSVPAFSLDELQLIDLDEFAEVPAATVLAPPKSPSSGGAPRLFESWSLVEEDAVPAAAPKPDPSAFGVEKMSAADFLAPDVERVPASMEPGMTLELIPPEDAIAPVEYEPREIALNELDVAVGRLILLGAAVDSLPSVGEFLDVLPAGLGASILLVQHVADGAVDALLSELAKHSALPLHLAATDHRVRHGELTVVPPDHQVLIRRDGTLDLRPASAGNGHNPSIDANFSALAGAFGRDALAILFAGKANDAVAGCQAVHDRGGRVWVEASSGEHYADMVSGVIAERLVDFSGSPAELATRLIEEYR